MSGQASRVTQRQIPAGWVVGLAVLSCLLTLVTIWSVAAQLLVAGYAVYRLTLRPSRRERTMLIVAIALIVVTLLAYGVAGFAVFAADGTFQETAVPIG